MIGTQVYRLSLFATAAMTMAMLLTSSMTMASTTQHATTTASDDPRKKCAWKKYRKSAPCVCRFTSKWKTKKCQQYFQQQKENESQVSSRIIGGSLVVKDIYPWFARAINRGTWMGCGGSLVSPEYVLTAAHCNEGWPKVDQYQIGALCPMKETNCGQKMVTVDVDKIYNHPKYNGQNMDNDLSLVKLKQRVTKIEPVKMDMENVVSNYADDHRGLYAIGFGDQNPNWGVNYSKQLKHTELGYMPTSKCNQYYTGNAIKDSMMCASDPNQDSCQGDSGGPLYDANDGIETLVGIVSWGYGCADPNYPGVYAKISNKWSWIKNTICQNHSSPKPYFCSGNNAPTPMKQEPTSSPIRKVIMPPTVSPIHTYPEDNIISSNTCSENEKQVEIVIELDGFPNETSWTVKDSTGVVQLKGKSYSKANTTITKTACLDKSMEYTFTINDSYGDGFSSDGSYLLQWDGEEIVYKTGNFGSTKSHTFGNQGGYGNTCESGEKEFRLNFKTDNNGRETYYEVKRGKTVVHDGGIDIFFSSNKFYEEKLCLPDNACYKLHFYDENGDGMCCEHKKGWYLVYYDEKKIRYSQFKNGFEQVTKFGNCS